MNIERRDLLPKTTRRADFSFDITVEAVGPFEGRGLSRVVPVPTRTKAYGLDAALFAADQTRLLLVVSEDEAVAAYAAARPDWNGTVAIADIAVARSFRRRGLARCLMDHAVRWTRSLGVGAIRLETQSTNVPACRFYESYGFVLGGFDRFLYRQLGEDVREETALFWYLLLDDDGEHPALADG